MLLTDRSVIFLDESRTQFFLHVIERSTLSPVWTLRSSLSEELDQEFRRNPEAYKEPRQLWWVQSVRSWNRISGPATIAEGAVQIPIESVLAVSLHEKWRVGPQVPAAGATGIARMLLHSDKRQTLQQYINQRLVYTELAAPVTQEYAKQQPVAKPTTIYMGYYYVFWTAAIVILLAVLLYARVPFWIAFPIAVAVCIFTFRSFGRVAKRAKRMGDR